MPERFEIYIVYKRRYINTLPFLSFFLNKRTALLNYLKDLMSGSSMKETGKNKQLNLVVVDAVAVS